jgi:hypothetical protein
MKTKYLNEQYQNSEQAIEYLITLKNNPDLSRGIMNHLGLRFILVPQVYTEMR